MLTCVTLVLTALRPGLAVSLVIFSASAALCAYKKLGPITRVPGTEDG